jgi:predicted dienelactone hydrolase
VSYSGQAGETPVGVIPAGTLRDTQRNKDIPLSVDYPTRGGPHPVIIFSHGFGSTPRGYTSLSAYWASHGYVVIRPAHADAGKLLNVRATAETWSTTTPQEWRDRVRDITVIIDSFQALERQYPELQGKLDSSRIGVGGHSYGAYTAMLVAGATTSVDGAQAVSYADPRVRAVLAMSPQGPSPSRGLTRESCSSIGKPVFFMTGSEDKGIAEGEDAAWRRQAYELSAAGDKWFMEIQGTNHFAFVERTFDPSLAPPTSREAAREEAQRQTEAERRRRMMDQRNPAAAFERSRNVVNLIRASSLSFWDTYLKNEPKGRDFLSKLKDRSDVVAASK